MYVRTSICQLKAALFCGQQLIAVITTVLLLLILVFIYLICFSGLLPECPPLDHYTTKEWLICFNEQSLVPDKNPHHRQTESAAN